MDESEVEKSCVKPEENQPTFIFDGGFCQIGAYMCMTGVEGRSQVATSNETEKKITIFFLQEI